MIAGALTNVQRAAIANHAASCARCHALLDGLIDADASVTAEANQNSADAGPVASNLMLEPGTRVGRYVIEAPLGAGGMCIVYAALDTELHRRVAIKLLRPGHHHQRGSHGSRSSEHLMCEARTLARLSHPNVVTVFDVGTHRGQLFLAMELVGGGNLRVWLRQVPRTTEDILDRLLDAGRGLAAAHAAQVVHRDVKPDNILVGLDGRARVTDFGLAELRPVAPDEATKLPLAAPDGSTRSCMIAGTPMYMAPEQLTRGETDARSDQWSFCATLYEALAGVRPFVIDDRAARAAAIREGRLAPAAPGRHVPRWVRKIVLRGLAAEPSARWPSMDSVVLALAARTRAAYRRDPDHERDAAVLQHDAHRGAHSGLACANLSHPVMSHAIALAAAISVTSTLTAHRAPCQISRGTKGHCHD
jgi:serine/threonine protein kinase